MRLLSVVLLLPASLAGQTLAPRPVVATLTGSFQDPALTESSGAARSRILPGVLFTINDSGHDPVVFAFDTTGRALGSWRVPGVANRDWEALSVGPCPAGSCLYLADTGDNLERRPAVTIYRLREPATFARFGGTSDTTPLELDSALVRYPEHPNDVEALWAGDDGSLSLVTKGRRDGVRLFHVPVAAFGAGAAVTAELQQVLPMVPDQRLGRWVTDAARAPDGRRVAIRTYTELYLYPLFPSGGLGTPRVCNLAGLEPQGEGVEWLDDHRLLLTSERSFSRRGGPIHVVQCDA
jgi:hypothetical protein